MSVLPVLAFTSLALLFSVLTRNGIAGVLAPVIVGLVMALLALIGSGSWMHVLLVAAAFDDWHGLLAGHAFYGPLILESIVSVAWIVVCLTASWLIFRRRDFAGASVGRRPGWVAAVRVVVGSAALIAVLAAATNLGPPAITASRLEASMTPAFNNLTLIQQRLLGRHVPPGAKLRVLTTCRRRAGPSKGPGDDWNCTFDVLIPQPRGRAVPADARRLRHERQIEWLLQGRGPANLRRPAAHARRARAQRRQPAVHDLWLLRHELRRSGEALVERSETGMRRQAPSAAVSPRCGEPWSSVPGRDEATNPQRFHRVCRRGLAPQGAEGKAPAGPGGLSCGPRSSA